MNLKPLNIHPILELLEQVTDPEIPVLTIADMGIIRGVEQVEEKKIRVTITPTYSGCPAMDHISDDIRKTLREAGFEAEVKLVLDPPWSSLWISEEGRKKMEAYGIAPPLEPTSDKKALLGQKRIVRCTHCGSTNTQMLSQFGSTACKALFRCEDCLEPFDYFKCI